MKVEASEDFGDFGDFGDYGDFGDFGDFGDIGDFGSTSPSNISYRYLEIPVLFQLLIPASDVVVPMVYAGPAIAFKMGVKGKTESDGKTVDLPDPTNESISDMMNTVDFGIAMGAGLGIKAGPGRLILDVRYTLGLTGIQDITDEEEKFAELLGESIEKERNMVLSFMLGYMFEF